MLGARQARRGTRRDVAGGEFGICVGGFSGIVGGVDSITHLAVGAAVGEWLLGRKLGNRALAWGALLGTLPDLDSLIGGWLSQTNWLWWHRGPSHSLLIMAVATYALAPWLAKLWKRDKVSQRLAGGFVLAAWASHVLVDCCTVYGTSVFWPLPMPRVAFNNLFIIDFGFTLPLAVALVWLAFQRGKKQWAKRRRLLGWGVGFAVGYLLLSVAMKSVASAGFAADLARRGVTYQRRMEAPTLSNILLWRAVVDRGDELWVGYRTVFERRATPVRWTIYQKDVQALAGMNDLREVKTVTWFTNGWWIARRHVEGVWLGDLRFDETRCWGDKKGMVDSRMVFAWDVLPAAPRDRLRVLRPTRSQPDGQLRRMVMRIVGRREAWEATPRLAGVTGSLPEFLAVQE